MLSQFFPKVILIHMIFLVKGKFQLDILIIFAHLLIFAQIG